MLLFGCSPTGDDGNVGKGTRVLAPYATDIRPATALASADPVPVETFTEAERARLAPHFTDLDGPVFALVNLPETVKGALFARYSRYPGTLRRLFLDEFADDVTASAPDSAGEGDRAAQLYERIFLGYGHDPVAPL